MAIADQIADLIALLGTSQAERALAALDPATAPPDGRSAADRLRALAALSPHIRFHPTGGGGPADWGPLFQALAAPGAAEALLARTDGRVPPHLGLAAAFAELLGEPVATVDGFTARHHDFYLREVLRLAPRAPVPDRAIARVELKPRVGAVVLEPTHRFTAGKDASGVERLYAPARQTIIQQAQVQSLRTVTRDSAGQLRSAPVANSADGLGKELPATAPSWAPFGADTHPVARLGFGLGSPALRLREGTRTIAVTLGLEGLPDSLPAGFWDSAFEVLLTGPKGWIGPRVLTPTRSGQTLRFTLTLSPEDPPVVDYDGAVHGLSVGPPAPLMQVLLVSQPGLRTWADLDGVALQTAQLQVTVQGLSPSALENDHGTLNPKKPCQPFGPVPVRGALLHVGCDEALSKRVTALTLTVTWKGVPDQNLATWYAGYPTKVTSNTWFKALMRFVDASGAAVEKPVELFDSTHAAEKPVRWSTEQAAPPKFQVTDAARLYTLTRIAQPWALSRAYGRKLQVPFLRAASLAPPETKPGFVTVQLQSSLLHQEYRKRFTELVLDAAVNQKAVALINEPYTPTMAGIQLSYTAQTDVVDFNSAAEDDLVSDEVQLYHLDCFGQHREHGHIRAQLPWASKGPIPLLPPHAGGGDSAAGGELLIGLGPLEPGASASLHVQVLDGSADPTQSRATIRWHVLAQNHWRALTDTERALDTTNSLLRSGIVQLLVPTEATTDNTLLPAGLIWFKASVDAATGAVCRLLEVANNAVELVFVDQGNDPGHLAAPLPPGSITRMKTPIAAVKAVKQPYASFGGAATEDDGSFRLRVSERLRHRGRAITAWDYERLVLAQFPQIHRVKCLPHARPGAWFAPGHLTLVLVPDLRNQNAPNPLRPMVDADTLTSVGDWLRAERMGYFPQVHVTNASFHRVRLDFKVRFRRGLEFNTSRARLEQDLKAALSPWAFDSTQALSFGGRVVRSVLLDFVEDLDYVEFVTDFKLLSLPDGATAGKDQHLITPDRPDALLVSDDAHTILLVEAS